MEKIKVTQQQRDNALDALHNMWPSVPERNVYSALCWWSSATDGSKAPNCGTIACFGGWCAWWPAFTAQGVVAGSCGNPFMASGGDRGPSEFLFGSNDLFWTRGEHKADRGFVGTDHALVTNRLRWLIENSVVVEPNKPRKAASGS